MASRMTCPGCGERNANDARFCVTCGIPLPRNSTVSSASQGPPENQLQTALTYLLIAVIGGVLGCMALVMGVMIAIVVPDPVGLGLVVALAVAPAVVYSLLVVALDRFDHEPWYTMLAAFLWGAIVATFFSLILNSFTGFLVFAASDAFTASVVLPVVVAPLVEETTKGLAVLILLLTVRHELDSVLDGMIYGALVGLGFAMTENALYFASFYADGGVAGLLAGFFLRAGFGGFTHAIFTAVVGASIGWARRRYGRGSARFVVPAAGLLLAMTLHAIWNGVAVAGSLLGGAVALFGIFGLALFLTLPAIVAALVIAVTQWNRHLMILRHQLAGEVTTGTLTDDEFRMLTTPHLRRQAAWNALTTRGIRFWWRLRGFMRLASRLAFQKQHAMYGESQPSGFRKRTNDELRDALAQTRKLLAQN